VPNLVKLAKAADPWSSCLAAYFNSKSEFFIWGLVDQTVHFSTMLVRERESGYAQPGLFNVLTTGPADLTVYREWGFVARLGGWPRREVLRRIRMRLPRSPFRTAIGVLTRHSQ